MRDKLKLIIFLFLAGILLYLGRDAIRKSDLMAWGLTLVGTTAGAVMIVALSRFRIELGESRHELTRRNAEINVALKVQKALFPRSFPQDKGLEFSAACIPARGIGGDYYDVISMPDGGVVFAIADVSGKGISAAILMASLQALLRAASSNDSTPNQVCKKLNDHLCQLTDSSQFATMFYARWDPATQLLRYVNAGHNPPLLVRRKEIECLVTGGRPLGMFPETEYEVAEILLHARDLLVLYSDGITDAGQREGKDFGEERLRSLVMLVADLTLTEIQARILTSVRSWSGSEPEDDMTLVLVRSQGHQSGGTE